MYCNKCGYGSEYWEMKRCPECRSKEIVDYTRTESNPTLNSKWKPVEEMESFQKIPKKKKLS